MHHDPGLDNERIFSILERTSSAFSIIGSMVVIATFCLSKAFHKPINRLVFYATFGNLMTNVSTLIALSFIKDSLSAGCQFQAFLIQMYALSGRSGLGHAPADTWLGSCLPMPSGH